MAAALRLVIAEREVVPNVLAFAGEEPSGTIGCTKHELARVHYALLLRNLETQRLQIQLTNAQNELNRVREQFEGARATAYSMHEKIGDARTLIGTHMDMGQSRQAYNILNDAMADFDDFLDDQWQIQNDAMPDDSAPEDATDTE